jgi:hypothetical protein
MYSANYKINLSRQSLTAKTRLAMLGNLNHFRHDKKIIMTVTIRNSSPA